MRRTEWKIRKLGDVADVQSGGTPLVHNKPYWKGDVAWYSSGELNDLHTSAPERHISKAGLENSNAKLFPAGSLLIGMYDTAALKMSILDRPAAFNQAIAGVRPNDQIDMVFVLHAINATKAEILERRRGVRQKNLSLGKIKDIELPTPPLPEQRRIVGILDEAFEGIATAKANAEKNLQNARALFESHLQSVFARPGPGWVEKTLEEAVDSKCSLSYGIVQPGEDKPGGLPIVRPTDLGARTIEMEGLKRIDPSLAESYCRTTLRGGDLLLCVRGSTGMVSVAAKALAGGNVTRGIVPIHFHDELVDQDFGYFLMCSEPVQKQIRDKTYGAALMQINICDLRKLVLPIPPRPIQEALANQFESLSAETDRLASIYQRKLAALDELKKSLLHQAFSGEL
jgi:type I restriction enzyme, S subunit